MSQSPVWAHHAFAAEFDGNKPVKFLDATVTKVSLINPHSWIHVDVKQPDGTLVKWAIENDNGTRRLETSPRFTQSSVIIGGIVQGGIEDRQIELAGFEWKTVELCFHHRKQAVFSRRRQPILVREVCTDSVNNRSE